MKVLAAIALPCFYSCSIITATSAGQNVSIVDRHNDDYYIPRCWAPFTLILFPVKSRTLKLVAAFRAWSSSTVLSSGRSHPPINTVIYIGVPFV